MARTLFGQENSPAGFESENDGSAETWLSPNVSVINVADIPVIINPETGGWAILDRAEANALSSPRRFQGKAAQFCRDAGLTDDTATGSSSARDLPLYFFEFIVTPACNLGCSYCFASAGPMAASAGADENLCELFIDRIAEYRAQRQTALSFVIEFTGGEPLLNFRAVKHTIEYAKARYGDLLNAEFCMQSNLTCLTRDMLTFAKEHGLNIGASCDGFRQIHDSQRPLASGKGSHRLVERNLQTLFQKVPANSGGVICVVTPENARLIPELMLYFACVGCRSLVLRPMEQLGRGADRAGPAKAYVDGLFDGLTSTITPLYRGMGEFIHEHYLALTFQHLLGANRPFMCERSPCGAAKNICAVSTNGDVYSCHQATGNARFYLGSLYQSSFSELLQGDVARELQSRSINQIASCAKCPYRSWCASPCPVTAFASHGTVMAPTGDCEIIRYRYQRALRGLINHEFDFDIIARLVGSDIGIAWRHGDLGSDMAPSKHLASEGGE